jgi:hypothetical protein
MLKAYQKFLLILISALIFIGLVVVLFQTKKPFIVRKEGISISSFPLTPTPISSIQPELQKEIYTFPALVLSKRDNYLVVEPAIQKENFPYKEYQVFISPQTIIEKIVLTRGLNSPQIQKRERVDFLEIEENTLLNLVVNENAAIHQDLSAKEITILVSE